VKQGLILAQEAKKGTFLRQLDVGYLLVVSVSQMSEEQLLYIMV
jgi:hypothetical protein